MKNDVETNESREFVSSAAIRKMLTTALRPQPKNQDNRSQSAKLSADGSIGVKFGFSMESQMGDTPANITHLNDAQLFFSLVRFHYNFVVSNSRIVVTFLNVFEYRSSTPGFPEHPLGEDGLRSVLESLFLSRPSTKALDQAKNMTVDQVGSLSQEEAQSLNHYFVKAMATLSSAALTRPRFVPRFYSNLRERAVQPEAYLCAIYLDYIWARENIPY